MLRRRHNFPAFPLDDPMVIVSCAIPFSARDYDEVGPHYDPILLKEAEKKAPGIALEFADYDHTHPFLRGLDSIRAVRAKEAP